MTARLPILTFHSIDDSGSVISVSPSDLRRVLGRLAAAGWRGTTVSEALTATRGEPRSLAISFDDGYANLRTEALPILRDHGFLATVFVIAGRAGRDNRWPGQPAAIPTLPLADWPDLAALVDAGWEVGAHGMDHLPLTAVPPDRAAREIEESRTVLERTLGIAVPLFAYPYGVFTPAALARTRRHYGAACGARLALARPDRAAERFDLPRIDAYYLPGFPPVDLDAPAGRGYLALRRWARRLRRRQPWNDTSLAANGRG